VTGWFVLRALVSGVIVAVVALVARRYPAAGALIASLPLVSILGMIWLWRDTGDAGNMAAHAEATFWFVLPSLPMFLLIPWLLRRGVEFWPALAAGCLLTILLYLITVVVAARFGVRI
jgi:hypothetical protein